MLAFFAFFAGPGQNFFNRQPILDKIKLKMFDLKGSLDDLNARTLPEDYALRIVRHASYKNEPHYFGRVDIPRSDLLMSESVKENFELFFVIAPVSEFSGPDDKNLVELATNLLIQKVRRHRERAIKDYLFN